jgi:hypothetical protein
VLLPRQDLDGRRRLVPHNLVTAWYWVEGGPLPRPVRLFDLQTALFAGEGYHAEVRAVLDADGDGAVSDAEAVLDSAEKVEAVRRRLAAVGVREPRIASEVQPFGTHHSVGPAAGALRDCGACHRADSRLTEPFVLAAAPPAAPLPTVVQDSHVTLAGAVRQHDGIMSYVPDTRAGGLYVLGRDRFWLVDAFGGLAVLGVLLGAAAHGGLRLWAYDRNNRRPRGERAG